MRAEAREVVVVGGGPAGAAAAAFLARAGRDVLLLDAARFPRDKVCGESVSPGAWPLLDALDLADAVRALEPWPIHGMALSSPNGTTFEGAYPGGAQAGFALTRHALDHALLSGAARAGAEVRQGARVTALLQDAGTVTGVVAQGDRDLGPLAIRARLVIAADGRYGCIARALGLREHARLRKFAVRGYWDGMQALRQRGELHVARGAYCGVAPLGPARANVTFVVDRTEMRAAARDLQGFYLRTLGRWPVVRERLASARLTEPARAIGPLALEARRPWRPGALAVGDAAGFFDPFTGEGITLALAGASWAAATVLHALRTRAGPTDLRDYARRREEATRAKFRLNRMLYEVVRRPRAADWMAARLARHPRLADRLVRVAGDLAPPSHAWSASALRELLGS